MANYTARSIEEIEKYLIKIAIECLNEVGEKVNDKLRSHIDSDVYIHQNEYYANGTGMPTYEFRESVTTSEVTTKGNEASVQIYHDKDKMSFDPQNHVHGSYEWKDGISDIRELLPQIISFGLSGDLFGSGWWQNPRPYYQNTLKELKEQGKLREWFIQALKKRGIKAI